VRLCRAIHRSKNHIVFIRADHLLQEPILALLIDERRKRAGFWTAPSVHLDRELTVIDRLLEG
jgi:hypothetical protein